MASRYYSLQWLDDRADTDVHSKQLIKKNLCSAIARSYLPSGRHTFKEKLGADFLKLAAINDNVTKKELETIQRR